MNQSFENFRFSYVPLKTNGTGEFMWYNTKSVEKNIKNGGLL